MRRTLLLAVTFSLVFATGIRAEEPFEDLPFDKALEKAGKEKKVVMIDFYTTWCGPCKMLDKSTWPNPDVKKLLMEKTVALKIDAEKNRELSQKYGISRYPQMVFIRPDGTEIDRLIGFRDAAAFLRDAAGPISGKDSTTAMRENIAKNPGDPMARYKLGETLMQRGKQQEALVELLWCFDHGAATKPEFAAARSALVLPKLTELGRTYAPAIKAMEERRAAALKTLTSPIATSGGSGAAATGQSPAREAAATLLMLDRALLRPAQSMTVYDALKTRGDESAEARRVLAEQLVDQLWNARRYDDIVRDAGDPMKRLDESIATYSRLTSNSQGQSARYAEYFKQQVTFTISRYYEALLGAGKTEAAAALGERILKFDSSGRAYNALITNAARSGDVGVAVQLVERARKSLPESEKALIEATAKNLPTQSTADGSTPPRKP